MAIYGLRCKTISRGKGQSAIASAAYRSEEKLKDKRLGKTFNYSRKQAVVHTEILAPKNAPAWATDREKLWNRVEAAENRKDSQLSREIEISLPIELNRDEQIELARDFVQQNFVNAGMIADVCIHEKEGNPHAHIMLTTRHIDENGFGLKNTEWNRKTALMEWRKSWADIANYHLAKAGHDITIDHRSHADRGIDLEPQHKIGTGVHRGRRTALERFQDHQRIARENGERIIADPQIGLDYVTRHQAVFGEYDIYRLAHRHSVDVIQYKQVCNAIFASDDLVKIGKDERGKDRFTTGQVLEAERSMMENGSTMAGKHTHQVDDRFIDQARATRTLTPDQDKALSHICKSGDVCCVVGYAGSGKSYTLGAVREAFEAQGYQVKGAALAGIAAEGLEQESGIESLTIARRLIDIENGRGLLTSRDILVIDEAGMVATRQMQRLIEHARERGAKVVLVGDGQQLQPIEAGGAFRGIYERIGGATMTEIRRQEKDWQKECTQQLEGSHAGQALDTYQDKGRIHEHDTQDQAIAKLVDDWKSFACETPTARTIMMAYRNVDVEQLNQHGRKAAQEMGRLSGKERAFETVKGERSFAKGDRILFLKNNVALGVKNGNLGTIERVRRKVIQVRLDNGEQCAFDADRYEHFTHGYAATVHKSQGATVDRTFALADKYFDRHTALTALTRHRDDVSLHWSKENFQDFEQLKETLTRERPKELAIDFCQVRAIEPYLSPVPVKKRVEQIIQEKTHEQDRGGELAHRKSGAAGSEHGREHRAHGGQHGDVGRRHTPGLEPGSAAGREPGQGVGRASTDDGQAMGPGESGPGTAGQGRNESQQGLDVAVMADALGRSADSWSDIADRIHALAAPLLRKRQGAGQSSQELGVVRGKIPEPETEAAKDHRQTLGRKIIEQTTETVQRQIEAMGCEKYDVMLVDPSSRKTTHKWTPEQIKDKTPWLVRENAKEGVDIYIRPSGDSNLVLLSMIDKADLDDMRQHGHDPAVTIEVGPGKYQAWVKLAEGQKQAPSEPHRSIILNSYIEKYGLHANQDNIKLSGILAGIRNRQVETPGKRACIESCSGEIAPQASAMIKQANDAILEVARKEREDRTPRPGKTHFNLSVDLPDGRSVDKVIRIQAKADPEHRRMELEKKAHDFGNRVAIRYRLSPNRAKDMTVNISEATREQIRSFEKQMDRSHSRGPSFGR